MSAAPGNNDLRISTDLADMDVAAVHRYLTTSYWARDVPLEVVRTSMENSLCFGLLQGRTQRGFARAITDRATFAYLADVYVDEDLRGEGWGKRLVEAVLAHSEMQGLRRIMLATRDAHGLYARFGFTALNDPDLFMQKHQADVYSA